MRRRRPRNRKSPTARPRCAASRASPRSVTMSCDMLAARLKSESFAPGEVILRQGGEGGSAYLVNRGNVRILLTHGEGLSEQVAVIGPGGFFGEMALLTGEPRNASAIAIEQVDCYLLSKADLDPLFSAHPELAERISTLLAERQAGLAAAREKLDEKTARAAARGKPDRLADAHPPLLLADLNYSAFRARATGNQRHFLFFPLRPGVIGHFLIQRGDELLDLPLHLRHLLAHVEDDLDAGQIDAQIARQMQNRLPAAPDPRRCRGACCRRCGTASAVPRARRAAASADGSGTAPPPRKSCTRAFDFPLRHGLYLLPDRRPRIFRMQLRQLAQNLLGPLVLHFRSDQTSPPRSGRRACSCARSGRPSRAAGTSGRSACPAES